MRDNSNKVTLDGRPAMITGLRMRFAVVSNSTVSCEFAWETVERIIKNDGKFKS